MACTSVHVLTFIDNVHCCAFVCALQCVLHELWYDFSFFFVRAILLFFYLMCTAAGYDGLWWNKVMFASFFFSVHKHNTLVFNGTIEKMAFCLVIALVLHCPMQPNTCGVNELLLKRKHQSHILSDTILKYVP